MELTTDQLDALEKLREFFVSTETVFLLKGSAGTGKTTLVQYIIKEMNIKVIGIAPTHKAKRVLRQRMAGCDVMTLASFLQKERKHSTLGVKVFTDATDCNDDTISKGCYILDEVSMVSDADFRSLMKIARANDNKILAIGDPYQIPAISQALVERDGVLYRRKCMVFSDKFMNAELMQIVRQNKDSQILLVARYIRANIRSEFILKNIFPEFRIERDEAYQHFVKVFAEKRVKIVTYTNEAVENHNRAIRAAFGFTHKFELGDILMGYENILRAKIENGADYKVLSATRELNGLRQKLIGWSLSAEDIEAREKRLFFFPDINEPQNKATIAKLLALARKVNSRFSTKKDYAVYRALKDKLLFLNDVYEFPEGSEMFYTEQELKKKEPLLFTLLADASATELHEDLVLLYGDMIDARLQDDKIVEGETFASAFCIFPKDLDYGYAYTAHKSQGSTIEVVFVDEDSFHKIRNRTNKDGLVEDRLTEKNQLKYVACTRASEQLFFI